MDNHPVKFTDSAGTSACTNGIENDLEKFEGFEGNDPPQG